MNKIGILLFAALARLLWLCPPWVALALLGAIAVAVAVEAVRSRRCATPTKTYEQTYVACHARSTVTTGNVFRLCCAQRGHLGPHEGTLEVWWDQ